MSQFPPSSKILDSSDGTKIYADAFGDPSKPSIVFVHGQALSGVVFDKIFTDRRYTEQFYLVRYDMRAHGRSDKPETEEGYASKLFADDFAAVMKAFNLHKPRGVSSEATMCVDIAAHFPENPFAGIVYLCGLPHVGPIIQRVITPEVLSMVSGLVSEDSIATSLSTMRTFIDLLFLNPTKIPWEFRVLLFGMTGLQRPFHRQLTLTRHQDPSRLFELGKQGLPLLVLGGSYDRQIMNDAVAAEMRPYFRNMEVHSIEKDGSHAVFLENQEETMDRILDFARRVNARAKL
ncbi:alpha/beta-hydrolase [Fomitiporia mediterranea MF3/22]|uniref:alpha/beta-hydrolase n=1 Tax=Fomitiporia mediterranea (strain MF3/22) TaxID=694068 RepID=UPI0004409722|nr:alpha/beta-hydrolase [Fomitiporia mediterranea MF3/22]EJD03381.1 alpha/beta-hydrolase [Fomitiporia mediterranea MF3/22]